MQENSILFNNIPYEVRVIKGKFLTAQQAQEAITDVLSDKSAFFDLPSLSDIIKVKSENVYGAFKLIVTLSQGSSHPEYMLNARVEELAPTLVNVVFETADPEELLSSQPASSTQELTQNSSSQAPTSVEERPMAPKKTPEVNKEKINFISQTSSDLGITYQELSELIGYSINEVISALSSGAVPPPMRRSIELYKENIALKKELEISRKIKTTLKEWLE